jgi:ABC-type ATPase involved in cell division
VPRAHILIESPVEATFRVEQVRGLFDLPHQDSIHHQWDVDIPVEGTEWQIGLIVGPSGSGKTTIGRRLFPDALFHHAYPWPETKAIVDGFPAHLEGREITQALSSVGFSSPPHWLKRYAHLSNGQKFRCEPARLMLEDAELVIFDEFTSVVDRDAARVSSAAVANALRRRGKPKLIALSCHYDIVDWLDPDWVYNTSDGCFTRRSLRRRPPRKRHDVRPPRPSKSATVADLNFCSKSLQWLVLHQRKV